MIIAASLTPGEEEKLLRVLRKHRIALGWTIFDIKGISPSILHAQDFNEGTLQTVN